MSYLKTLTQKASGEESRILFDTALKYLEQMTYVTVSSLEQLKAADLRRVGDKTGLYKLALDAYIQIKKKITPEYERVLTAYLNDLDSHIREMIESKLFEIKQSNKSGEGEY
jgi:hypothetical protein